MIAPARIITNNITAHQAMPFSDCTTAGLKTRQLTKFQGTGSQVIDKVP